MSALREFIERHPRLAVDDGGVEGRRVEVLRAHQRRAINMPVWMPGVSRLICERPFPIWDWGYPF